MSSQQAMKRLLFLFFIGFTMSAQAHKVNVFAYAEGDQVYVEGYFGDGTKAKNSDVTVFASDGRQLIQGKTNDEGGFTFPIGEMQTLRIILNAGQGHQADYEVPVDEVKGQVATSPQSTADIRGSSTTNAPGPTVTASGDSSTVSETMIRKAVAQGVLPLARQISELKERRSLSDIVGGIGLIVGLLGGFAYFKARQDSRRPKTHKDA